MSADTIDEFDSNEVNNHYCKPRRNIRIELQILDAIYTNKDLLNEFISSDENNKKKIIRNILFTIPDHALYTIYGKLPDEAISDKCEEMLKNPDSYWKNYIKLDGEWYRQVPSCSEIDPDEYWNRCALYKDEWLRDTSINQ